MQQLSVLPNDCMCWVLRYLDGGSLATFQRVSRWTHAVTVSNAARVFALLEQLRVFIEGTAELEIVLRRCRGSTGRTALRLLTVVIKKGDGVATHCLRELVRCSPFLQTLDLSHADGKLLLATRALTSIRPQLRILTGWTELHAAAARGRLDEVAQLISKGADVNAAAPPPPLAYACFEGYLEVAAMLIAHGADPLQSFPWEGRPATPFAMAAQHSRRLVEGVLNVLSPEAAQACLASDALALAAASAPLECVAALLERKASTSAPDRKGNLPLVVAVRRARWPVVQALLAAGATVPSPPSPLLKAALRDPSCCPVAFGALFNAAAEQHPGLREQAVEITDLMFAALDRPEKGVACRLLAALLRREVRFDRGRAGGPRTLLHVAASHGNERAAEFLLLEGMADVRARDSGGRTAWLVALENGHQACAAVIAAFGECEQGSLDPLRHLSGFCFAVHRV